MKIIAIITLPGEMSMAEDCAKVLVHTLGVAGRVLSAWSVIFFYQLNL